MTVCQALFYSRLSYSADLSDLEFPEIRTQHLLGASTLLGGAVIQKYCRRIPAFALNVALCVTFLQ